MQVTVLIVKKDAIERHKWYDRYSKLKKAEKEKETNLLMILTKLVFICTVV